jgi:hypothetical protein
LEDGRTTLKKALPARARKLNPLLQLQLGLDCKQCSPCTSQYHVNDKITSIWLIREAVKTLEKKNSQRGGLTEQRKHDNDRLQHISVSCTQIWTQKGKDYAGLPNSTK